jgi:F0F1-type ATP synthase assembly protein I
MAVTVGLFSYGGHLLDQQLSTSPAFLLTGLVVGALGGFLHLVNLVAPELLPFRKKPRDPETPEDPDT